MQNITFSYETIGAAPRTLFDILSTGEDAEDSADGLYGLTGADSDGDGGFSRRAGTKSRLLS